MQHINRLEQATTDVLGELITESSRYLQHYKHRGSFMYAERTVEPDEVVSHVLTPHNLAAYKMAIRVGGKRPSELSLGLALPGQKLESITENNQAATVTLNTDGVMEGFSGFNKRGQRFFKVDGAGNYATLLPGYDTKVAPARLHVALSAWRLKVAREIFVPSMDSLFGTHINVKDMEQVESALRQAVYGSSLCDAWFLADAPLEQVIQRTPRVLPANLMSHQSYRFKQPAGRRAKARA